MSEYSDVININKKNAYALFKYIDMTTRFDHVVYKGLPYFERENTWQNSDVDERPDHDPDVSCSGYNSCEATNDLIYPKNIKHIEFVINHDMDEEDLDTEQFSKSELRIVNKIIGKDPKKILLSGYNKLIISNVSGPNNDHRGSDHCKIVIPYQNKTIDKEPITLYDLMIRYYLIKSHHWDKNYEMFCRLKYKINKKKMTAKIFVEFDHGS